MTATLHIRVKNDTRQDVAGLIADLDSTVEAAEQFGESMGDSAQEAGREIAKLRQEQAQELRIIHEQRAGWSSLASTALPAIASITTASLNYATALARIEATQKLLAQTMTPLIASKRAMNSAIDLGEKVAIRGAAALAGYGAAAATVATVTGGATVALTAFEAVLARTGAQKNALGEMETNLDRAREATKGLTDDIIALGSAGVAELRTLASETTAWAYELTGAKTAVTEIDRAATAWTDQFSINLRELGGYMRGISRDTVAASARLEAAQQASVDDFERVRAANDSVAEATKSRAEAVRIAGLATTAAIDGEIDKLKEQRGVMAANNDFTEDAQRKYIASVEALERRRTQLLEQRERQEADARRKRLDDEKQHQVEVQKLYDKAYNDRNAEILKQNAAFEKGLDDEVQDILQQHQKQQQAFDQLTQMKAKAAQQQKNDYIARWREAVSEVANIVTGGAGTGTGDQIQQLRSSIDPRDIARNVGDSRAAAAERQFRESGEGKRREDELVSRGMERTDAERQVMAQQRRLRDQARAQGFRDTMQGRANPEEYAQAENQAANAIIGSAQKTGQLSNVVTQGMREAAQTAIAAELKADQAIAVAMQIRQALQANAGRSRGTNGTLKQ